MKWHKNLYTTLFLHKGDFGCSMLFVVIRLNTLNSFYNNYSNYLYKTYIFKLFFILFGAWMLLLTIELMMFSFLYTL